MIYPKYLVHDTLEETTLRREGVNTAIYAHVSSRATPGIRSNIPYSERVKNMVVEVVGADHGVEETLVVGEIQAMDTAAVAFTRRKTKRPLSVTGVAAKATTKMSVPLLRN